MVDLLGITCGGDCGGGVNVIALVSESCCRRRHKSSASVSYSSSLSLSKSVLNDIYCTSRLNGGEVGIDATKLVVVSNGTGRNAAANMSRKISFSFRECNSRATDRNKLFLEEVSTSIDPRFRLRTHSRVPFGWLINLGQRCS